MNEILAKRIASAIEEAFDEDVKLLARAVLPKVTGGQSIIGAEQGFQDGLAKLLDVRERQLADAVKVMERNK